MNLYVDVRAGRDGNGTEKMPFRRINEAAKVAKPGDIIAKLISESDQLG